MYVFLYVKPADIALYPTPADALLLYIFCTSKIANTCALCDYGYIIIIIVQCARVGIKRPTNTHPARVKSHHIHTATRDKQT